MAGTVWAVECLVVEYVEVQRETEADGVCRSELSDGNVGRSLVRLQRLVRAIFPLIAGGKPSEIMVIVTHPAIKSVSKVFDHTIV